VNRRKTAYQLSASQVSTPPAVVSLFWRLTHERRDRLDTVLDIGAGDCRFAVGGKFNQYTGVEIDRNRSRDVSLPDNAELIHTCAFKHKGNNFDACIGNPPYVRHHDIENPWKDATVAQIKDELGVSLNKHCNLYLYFLCLGLLKTRPTGLVALVIPYEWVSRPSARALRDYIRDQGWSVTVYRFQKPIFDGVLTTASVSVIDKKSHHGRWNYFEITPDFKIVARTGMAAAKVLEYAKRGENIWALRGLSPGSQKIFTLTEGERIHFGLTKKDVVPCVTSLKKAPPSLKLLTPASFKKHFVDAGARCWLIKSYRKKLSPTLRAYLAAVSEKLRDNYTCCNQTPWYNYAPHPTPQLLFGSGFTKFGPKVLINSIGARAIGSVWGIHSKTKLARRQLQQHLLAINFEKKVVAHAKTLKKVEVRQLNTVLNAFVQKNHTHGKASRRG
jgi:predicted RNA methylase